VSKVKRLVTSYGKYIAIPWRADAAAAQRVIFCVYNQSDELRLRSKIDEFEIATKRNGHNWVIFNLTESFAQWLTGQKYVQSYFKKPNLLASLYPKYLEYIISQFSQFLEQHQVDESYVVAVKGVGSLFGFLKIKEVVEKLAPMVSGRLLVFFPGSYEDNNYRLLDGYDGWNYLAVPITADKDI
jgi:hypothetical protein